MHVVEPALLASISTREIRKRRLTGDPERGQAFRGNIVESRVHDARFERLDLSRCDWKDSLVENVTFVDCELGYASAITNAYRNCSFIRCRFADTAITDCTFTDCVFDACDLSSIIIKTSRLEGCAFLQCRTSNRVVEGSILLDTRWSGMKLRQETVLGNFGVRITDLEQCTFESQLGSEQGGSTQATLPALIPDMSVVEAFRAAYFRTGSVESDASVLQSVLDIRTWAPDALVQTSFGVQLTTFVQFLVALYSRNECPLYPLLILHTNNFRFMEWVGAQDDLLALYQHTAGAHLLLTREVDLYAVRLSQLADAVPTGATIHFAAEGPVDKVFFQRWFHELELRHTRVLEVRPRNSPVDLAVAFAQRPDLIALFALFLACRTKLEIVQVGKGTRAEEIGGTGLSTATNTVAGFSAGFSSHQPSSYEVNVRTLLPRSLLLDLKLTVSVAVFRRVRTVLVGLIAIDSSPAAAGQAIPPPPGASPRPPHSPEE